MVNWHGHCRGIWDIATGSRIIDVVSDLLGDTVVLRHRHLFAKLPGDPKRVSWHQDASYWPLTPSRVVSAWLAIDDTDVTNSAMQVIPGSNHHAQVTFRDRTATEHNVLVQTVDNPADYGDPPIALEMRAGQISLHSDWILHGSDPTAQAPPLRAGDALPLHRRARLQRLERQLHLVPRHRRRRPLDQPPPPRRRTDPHPRQRLLSGPRQRRIPQPITPMLSRPRWSKPLTATYGHPLHRGLTPRSFRRAVSPIDVGSLVADEELDGLGVGEGSDQLEFAAGGPYERAER